MKKIKEIITSHNESPDVSIIVLTYNHENYIENCLNSILEQETNFSVEIIIHDDCSTDSNQKKINNLLSEKFKNVIKIYQKENQLSKNKNVTQELFNKCKGKYISWIDGDDYWVGNLRIEKMVSFLEINTEYSMAFHDVYSFSNEDQTLKPFNEDKSKRDYTTNDLLNGSFCYLLMGNMCLRNIKLDLPGEFYLVRNNDMFIPLFWGKHGGAKYLPEAGLLGYRVHSNGYWSGVDQKEKQIEQVITGLQLVSYHLRNRNINAAIGHAKIRLAPLFNS